MSYVITLLLVLILVALVSSDKAAANGVRRVLKMAALVTIAVSMSAVSACYWLYLEVAYPSDSSEWRQLLNLVVAALIPQVIWLYRKDISSEYQRDKRSTFKLGAFGLLFMLCIMAGGAVARHVQAVVPYAGWLLILVPMVVFGLILMVRTVQTPEDWRLVWLGHTASWEALRNERDAIEDADRQDIENLASLGMTKEQEEQWWLQRNLKIAAARDRLNVKEDEINLKASNIKPGVVRDFFWILAFLAAIGVAKELWNEGFQFAMGLSFVKGREWMAGTVSAFGLMVIAGLLGQIWEWAVKARKTG
jgi:hypothetical protein